MVRGMGEQTSKHTGLCRLREYVAPILPHRDFSPGCTFPLGRQVLCCLSVMPHSLLLREELRGA